MPKNLGIVDGPTDIVTKEVVQNYLADLVIPSISYVIAPFNAVNKSRADLILQGPVYNDALAINNALMGLSTMRGAGTQSIRVDFLGGDIDVKAQIAIPNYFNVYGNRVVLTKGTGLTGNIISGGICNIDGITIGDVSGISGGIRVTTGNVSNCIVGNFSIGAATPYGIYVTTGNVSNCIVGNGTSCTGIFVNTGNVSYCVAGNVSGGAGIYVLTGNISNCTVGSVSSSSRGIYVTTGNISNCTIGAITTSATGIYVLAGMNNIISGNKIAGGTGSTAKGINVTGANCIVTNNNIGTATSGFVSIAGDAIIEDNYYGGVMSSTIIGVLASLTTTIKTSVVNAINWLYGIVGDITTLTTTTKTSCVAAINEVVQGKFNLDQTIPQTITGGTPTFEEGIKTLSIAGFGSIVASGVEVYSMNGTANLDFVTLIPNPIPDGSSGNLTVIFTSGVAQGMSYTIGYAGTGSWSGSGYTWFSISMLTPYPVAGDTFDVYEVPVTSIGLSTSQKLAFYGATPIVQPVATTDLGSVLSLLGLRAGGTAYPITTGGTVTLTGLINLNGQISINGGTSIALSTTTGTKIGTSTSQKLAFYGVTPITQPSSVTELGTVLSNLGLRYAGTAYPITTSGAVAFSGTINLNGRYIEKVYDLGTYSTGTVTIDCNVANNFKIMLIGNVTLAFSNIPTTGKMTINLDVTLDGTARTMTFPASVKWAYGAIPSLHLTQVNEFSFVSFIKTDASVVFKGSKGGEFNVN